MSAATDAIGWYVFIGTLYELEVPSRDCHVASLLAMTRQGNARCTSALLPLNIPYKAVTDRRYTPYFGVCRFHGRLYGSEVRSRERHAAPLQWCTPFNDSRYELEVPSRDCHVASLLAMTNLWLLPFY